MQTVLSQIAIVQTNLKDADFYIQRRGSLETVGKPYRQSCRGYVFNSEDIGIKVTDSENYHAGFLFWVFYDAFNKGAFKGLANGTTNLVNVRVSDIRKIIL
ncbi:conserved hypothetical protein [Vibrio chagasii]|nr:conserved hypothetical protein [Vibrio chagasii]